MDVEESEDFDFADPVDITEKLPGDFYELLASKKWQERREALDALLEKAKTPKILDKDYSELITALSKVQQLLLSLLNDILTLDILIAYQ